MGHVLYILPIFVWRKIYDDNLRFMCLLFLKKVVLDVWILEHSIISQVPMHAGKMFPLLRKDITHELYNTLLCVDLNIHHMSTLWCNCDCKLTYLFKVKMTWVICIHCVKIVNSLINCRLYCSLILNNFTRYNIKIYCMYYKNNNNYLHHGGKKIS